MIRALIAILLLVTAACGQREAPYPPAKPALWAVEDREGHPRGWLFGTIHALPDGSEWRTPVLARVIETAGMLVVEVRDLDPQRTAAILERLATDEPGPPLARRLPPAGRDRLAEFLAKRAVPATRFDALETWAAALALSRLAANMPAANGVDLAVMAQFDTRPIEELEGAAGQLAIFDALPERDQRSLLTAVLVERRDPTADARALAKAWLAGDLASLERTVRGGLLADPALHRALAVDRNTAWATKLMPLFESDRRPLVAVGAAHMLGPEGLPALLAAQGYRVVRLQ